jgi:Ca2+-binding EF-hand superfamily protein
MDIVNRGYYPLRGPAWANISDTAKDLVAGMLKKSPQERLSVKEVLQHEWLKGAASEKSLGEDYVRRIKHLALRHKLKKCFMLGHIEESHKKRQKSLLEELPFLSSNGKSGDELLYPCVSSSLGPMFVGEEFSSKLRDLKNMLVNTIYGNRFETGSCNRSSGTDETDGSSHPNKRMRLGFDGDVDFDVFCSFMQSNDLEILANKRIFSIFDTNGDGNICMREFLMTIVAMREMGSDRDDVEAAQLYFRMFDIDEDGFIGKEELELVIGCLLHDGTGLLVIDENDVNTLHIDEIFCTIDTNGDGQIDLTEFKVFYETVLLPSSRQSLKSTSGSGKNSRSSKSSSLPTASAVLSEPLPGDVQENALLTLSSSQLEGERCGDEDAAVGGEDIITVGGNNSGPPFVVGEAMSIVSS